MRPRLMFVAVVIALILIVATFPMRLALAMAGAERSGLTAREVNGSVWDSELIEARLGALPLGNVTASLSPLALLGGEVELAFKRPDPRLGALAGRLHGSNPRGLSDLNGTSSLSGGLGMVPVDQLRFEGAAVRFDDRGRCVSAGGRIQLTVGTSIAGLDLTRGLSGPLRCADGRAEAALTSQSGMERLTLAFDGSGAYRAQFAIQADDPAMAAALSVIGFRPSDGGFVLVSTGRF